MSSRVQEYKKKFDGLSQRERSIVLIALLAVLVFLWDQLLYAPMERASKRLELQISSAQNQINEQSAEVVAAMQNAAIDPNHELRQLKQQLEASVGEADLRIESLTQKLIPPRQMARVLEQVLRQETRLSLVKVTNIPARRLSAPLPDAQASSGTQQDKDQPMLYQHGVELQLEGEYFQTLRYLQALERLPWQVLWSELEYEVQEYPRASIRLQLNTLSTDAGWIGV